MIKFKMIINRNDGNHNYKEIKKIFNDINGLKEMEDEFNYIKISLKQKTMKVQIEMCISSFNYYITLLKGYLLASSNDVIAIMNTLIMFIDEDIVDISWKCENKIKFNYPDGSITVIKESDCAIESEWVFCSLDIHVTKIRPMSSSDIYDILSCANDQYSTIRVFYDHDEKKFIVKGDKSSVYKDLAIYVAILYNAGVYKLNETYIVYPTDNNKIENKMLITLKPAIDRLITIKSENKD